MRKWIKIISIGLVIILLALSQILFPISSYLPHSKIILGLPFESSDPPTNMIPMGETVDHPKTNSPKGHPGIDFQWNHAAKLLASFDGRVVEISVHETKNQGMDVVIQSGVYQIRYKELDDTAGLKVGQLIKKGDLVGRPHKNIHPNGSSGYQLHWEFASINVLKDRFCPESYFDEASRKVMEHLWTTVGYTYDGKFPYLCSGDYYNKAE